MRLCFYGSIIVILTIAFLPIEGSGILGGDKVAHFAGFLILTFLGVASYGRQRSLLLAVVLIAFGAMIELLQAIPLVGRDGELLDWIADTAGIVSALAVVGAKSVLDSRVKQV